MPQRLQECLHLGRSPGSTLDIRARHGLVRRPLLSAPRRLMTPDPPEHARQPIRLELRLVLDQLDIMAGLRGHLNRAHQPEERRRLRARDEVALVLERRRADRERGRGIGRAGRTTARSFGSLLRDGADAAAELVGHLATHQGASPPPVNFHAAAPPAAAPKAAPISDPAIRPPASPTPAPRPVSAPRPAPTPGFK